MSFDYQSKIYQKLCTEESVVIGGNESYSYNIDLEDNEIFMGISYQRVVSSATIIIATAYFETTHRIEVKLYNLNSSSRTSNIQVQYNYVLA